MIPKFLATAALITFIAGNLFAQDSAERSAPFTDAEREAVYTKSIDNRANAILKELALTDTNKAARIHDAVVAQYRALRARDAALDTMFQSLSKNAPGIETNRNAILRVLSQQLHDQFLGRLAADLTPGQIEKVKDRMTYNKVKVIYDAYCEMLPNLSDAEKAKMLEALKTAREEAMDGGSADEKTAIFEKYKGRINNQLSANGHDVGKASREWAAKQKVKEEAAAPPASTTR
jgi:hypothetical protein